MVTGLGDKRALVDLAADHIALGVHKIPAEVLETVDVPGGGQVAVPLAEGDGDGIDRVAAVGVEGDVVGVGLKAGFDDVVGGAPLVEDLAVFRAAVDAVRGPEQLVAAVPADEVIAGLRNSLDGGVDTEAKALGGADYVGLQAVAGAALGTGAPGQAAALGGVEGPMVVFIGLPFGVERQVFGGHENGIVHAVVGAGAVGLGVPAGLAVRGGVVRAGVPGEALAAHGGLEGDLGAGGIGVNGFVIAGDGAGELVGAVSVEGDEILLRLGELRGQLRVDGQRIDGVVLFGGDQRLAVEVTVKQRRDLDVIGVGRGDEADLRAVGDGEALGLVAAARGKGAELRAAGVDGHLGHADVGALVMALAAAVDVDLQRDGLGVLFPLGRVGGVAGDGRGDLRLPAEEGVALADGRAALKGGRRVVFLHGVNLVGEDLLALHTVRVGDGVLSGSGSLVGQPDFRLQFTDNAKLCLRGGIVCRPLSVHIIGGKGERVSAHGRKVIDIVAFTGTPAFDSGSVGLCFHCVAMCERDRDGNGIADPVIALDFADRIRRGILQAMIRRNNAGIGRTGMDKAELRCVQTVSGRPAGRFVLSRRGNGAAVRPLGIQRERTFHICVCGILCSAAVGGGVPGCQIVPRVSEEILAGRKAEVPFPSGFCDGGVRPVRVIRMKRAVIARADSRERLGAYAVEFRSGGFLRRCGDGFRFQSRDRHAGNKQSEHDRH